MYKKCLSVFLLIILLLTITSTVYAAGLEGDGVISRNETPQEDEGGMFERTLTMPINAIVAVFQNLEEIGKFETLDKLIFNHGLSEKEINLAPYNAEEWKKLHLWYAGMATACGGLSLLAVLISSYKLMIAGASNPRARANAMEDIWRWLGAVALIAGAPALFTILFAINNAFVDSLQAVAANVGADAADLSKLSVTGDSVITNITTGSVFGTAIVKLMFCGIEAWLNIIYIVRKFALIAIYIFTPIMAWLWAINKNVNAFPVYFGELLSNAFMQTFHALCLLIFLTFCNINTHDGSWVTLLIWLGTLLPLAEMLRNSLQGVFTRMAGLDEGGVATKALGVMGLGSAIGAANLIKTATPIKPPNLQNSFGDLGGSSMMGQGMATTMGSPGATMGGAGSFGTGGDITGNAPAGYTQSQSGIFVPQSASPNGNLNNQSNTANNAVGNTNNPVAPGAGLGMVRAANAARTAGNVTKVATGLTAGLMFAAIPGGENIANTVTRGVTGAASTTAFLGNMGKETYNQYQEQKDNQPDYSIGQAFRDVTNSESNREAAKTAAGLAITEGIAPILNDPYMAQNSIRNAVPSLDGHRWR